MLVCLERDILMTSWAILTSKPQRQARIMIKKTLLKFHKLTCNGTVCYMWYRKNHKFSSLCNLIFQVLLFEVWIKMLHLCTRNSPFHEIIQNICAFNFNFLDFCVIYVLISWICRCFSIYAIWKFVLALSQLFLASVGHHRKRHTKNDTKVF